MDDRWGTTVEEEQALGHVVQDRKLETKRDIRLALTF